MVSASTFITALVLDQPSIHLCITRPPENREARAISNNPYLVGRLRDGGVCDDDDDDDSTLVILILPTGLSGALSKNKEVA